MTKADDDLEEIVAHRFVAPVEDELMETLMKERNDCQDGSCLNDDVEQVALPGQPLLGDEKMAG